MGSFHTPTVPMYLIQRCDTGFMVREFLGHSSYYRGEYMNPHYSTWKVRRALFDKNGKSVSAYNWGVYKQQHARWIKNNVCYPRSMLMLKLNGLTVKLVYENNELVEASTRGDGDVGENITHNVCSIAGIPILINHKERLVVTGEAFISTSDFEELKATKLDSTGKPYKNGCNLAAGSVRQLDPEECKTRRVRFQAFNVLEGFDDIPVKSKKLGMLPALGFDVFKFIVTNRPLNSQQMEDGIKRLQTYAN